MSHLYKTGWGPYHGARAKGLGPRQGIGITTQPIPPIGAPASAVGKSSSLYDNRSNKSQTVNIETGDINMHVPGVRDAGGVADAFAGELKRVATLASWNTGLA